MGLKGLTVNTAPEAEPHIYAEDDAAIYQAICGSDGVFDIGQKCDGSEFRSFYPSNHDSRKRIVSHTSSHCHVFCQ